MVEEKPSQAIIGGMRPSQPTVRTSAKPVVGSTEFRILILALIAIAVYANSLPNDFVLDDGLYITQNPQVTHFSLRAILAPHKASNTFRPVTFGSYALQWLAGGPRPLWFHLLNVLLHAGATLLLFFLLRKLFENLPHSETLSFTAALLFAVHPIHSEAVAGITGRAELFAAAFVFAAWLLHLRDGELAALICFALALLSKESAIAFAALAPAGDFVRQRWKPALRYVRLIALSLSYIALLWFVQGRRFGQPAVSKLDNPLAELPPRWRILNACRVAWKYLALQLYPAHLSSDYSFSEIPVYRDWQHTLPAALGVLFILAVWLWALRKRRAALALSGTIYLAGFAVTANILIPTGTIMGERLAYLPSAGFCLLAASCWQWLLDRQKKAACAALAAVVLASGARTLARNRDWSDDYSLAASAVRNAPGSAKAHTKMGDMYLSRQKYDLARKEFDAALRIYPGLPDAMADYGLLEFREGNYQAAGRMMETAYNTSDRNNPNYDFMAVNYAAVLMQTGHMDAALDLLNQEIKESPNYARAWSNRAVIHYSRGDNASARRDAQTALRLDPANLQAVAVLQRASRPRPANSAQGR